MTYRKASDGLPARVVGAWSDEKLFIAKRYMDILTGGMKNLWDNLVYADFLAGPGVCVGRESGIESKGSPLLALDYKFTRIFLNDSDRKAVDALRKRTRGDGRVHITQMDCNEAVDAAIEHLIPSGAPRSSTLGLAFIDPTAFQMRFESIRRLAERGRFDLLVTFMTSFPKRFGTRIFDENSEFAHFIGIEAYKRLKEQGRLSPYNQLELYRERLSDIGYKCADDVSITKANNQTIYHQVFASKHPRGCDFFKKSIQRQESGQLRMPIEEETL